MSAAQLKTKLCSTQKHYLSQKETHTHAHTHTDTHTYTHSHARTHTRRTGVLEGMFFPVKLFRLCPCQYFFVVVVLVKQQQSNNQRCFLHFDTLKGGLFLSVTVSTLSFLTVAGRHTGWQGRLSSLELWGQLLCSLSF